MKHLNALDNIESMIEDFMRMNWEHVGGDRHYSASVSEKVVEYLCELIELRKVVASTKVKDMEQDDIKVKEMKDEQI